MNRRTIAEAIDNLKKRNLPEATRFDPERGISQVNLGEYAGANPPTGMDPRHYAPHGYSTFKFTNPSKAAEFIESWNRKGGVAVLAAQPKHSELYGQDVHTFVVFASPLGDFYGGGSELDESIQSFDGDLKSFIEASEKDRS